jgi:hypothetical protein
VGIWIQDSKIPRFSAPYLTRLSHGTAREQPSWCRTSPYRHVGERRGLCGAVVEFWNLGIFGSAIGTTTKRPTPSRRSSCELIRPDSSGVARIIGALLWGATG